jgi:hypothetical protein
MPAEGSSYKRFVGHYTGYENTTATAQTITYPLAFSLTPKITTNDAPSGSTTTTALTLPASMTTPVTGWIIVEGYWNQSSRLAILEGIGEPMHEPGETNDSTRKIAIWAGDWLEKLEAHSLSLRSWVRRPW